MISSSNHPQNISGASQQNTIVAAFSQTTEADGDLFKTVLKKSRQTNKIKWLFAGRPA